MEFIILSEALEEQGIIDMFLSAEWRLNFYSGGSFTIIVPATEYFVRLIKKHRYIFRTDTGEAGYITSVSEQVSKESHIIIATGSMTDSIFDKRALSVAFSDGISLQQALRDCGGYPFENMVYDFENAVDYTIGKENNTANLGETARALLKSDKRAISVVIDREHKQLICSFKDAVDRSVSQEENPHIIFSVDSGELASMEYNYSEVDCYNHITGIANLPDVDMPIRVDGSKEHMRKYVLSQDGYNSGLQITTAIVETEAAYYITHTEAGEVAVINYEITQRILKNLCREQIINYSENYTCSAVDDNYRQRWFVGDIITIYDNIRNIYIDKQIEEVAEIFETSGKSLDIILGSPLRTLYDLAKGV